MRIRRGHAMALLTATLLTAGPLLAQTTSSDFVKATAEAMDRMMAEMHIASSGDVDRDFANMMIPHHKGAIDMAVAELRYGKNEQLRRVAQEIIVDQQQEIAAMKMALGDPLPPSASAPTAPGAARPSAAQPSPHHMHMEH